MAYSPVEQGRLVADAKLISLTADLNTTPARVALAWLLAQDNVNAGRSAHVHDNRVAGDAVLAPNTLALLQRLYPRPGGRVPLEMLYQNP
jgi:diketogulonate reductase-like aldo/keto reductase